MGLKLFSSTQTHNHQAASGRDGSSVMLASEIEASINARQFPSTEFAAIHRCLNTTCRHYLVP